MRTLGRDSVLNTFSYEIIIKAVPIFMVGGNPYEMPILRT